MPDSPLTSPENLTPPTPSIPIDPPPPVVKPKKDATTLIIIGAIVFLVFVILATLIIGFTLLTRPHTPVVPPPPPTAQPTAPINPQPSSKFASDSALLKIRDNLKAIRTSVDSLDLFDAQISPPDIDTNIHVKP